MQKIAPISSKKIAPISSTKCRKCSSKGDVFDRNILLCAICYMLQVAPHKVDKLRKKII